MTKLRPGAWVAAGGGKWAAPWLVGVNLQARMLHAPFARSFEGAAGLASMMQRVPQPCCGKPCPTRRLGRGGGAAVRFPA